MRALAAIIVAVMPVTTGGPLRCPCRLAALFKTEPRVCDASRPAEDRPEKRGCPCKSHGESKEPGPGEPKPAPGHPPCSHHLGIDLAPPLAGAERVVHDRDPGNPAVAAVNDTCLFVPPLGTGVRLLSPGAGPSQLPDRLRYCHAFRC